ncbi:enolase C-terminal domain-like protein [Rhodopseudomonas sp. B29]|uniref:enolase C-terminal domain-like protein n=1 Tax=Rhodopseudomonas sp. B29 TaxID=95607 RepID=UPI00034B9783|nr:enolase C-terminal domain-like protein [Rhodopseudomonas sp. B29]
MKPDVAIEGLGVRTFTIPTDRPEADGTMSWDSTTIVLVEASAGGKTGLGYTYSSDAIAPLIHDKLAAVVRGKDAFAPQAAWRAMQRAVRNLGREGLAATAISAVDAALYDLKARLLGVPLATLLGRYRDEVPIYGSGGFTSYTDAELCDQLAGWVGRDGCAFVKMKIGSDPARDPERVRIAKQAIGDRATLFVDANGAYGVKQALALADRFAEQGVGWFEEPVSSDDRSGLRAIRQRAPACIEIAAGEYCYTADYARHMLAAEAVDVMQADVTRCGGITGFLQIAALCEAHHIDLSGHCAPALHLHVACAAPRLRHLEWFHDHVRIEHMLFDGAPTPRNGVIRPDLSRTGNGLAFKAQDAARYAA